jgi:hypothetical protein
MPVHTSTISFQAAQTQAPMPDLPGWSSAAESQVESSRVVPPAGGRGYIHLLQVTWQSLGSVHNAIDSNRSYNAIYMGIITGTALAGR